MFAERGMRHTFLHERETLNETQQVCETGLSEFLLRPVAYGRGVDDAESEENFVQTLALNEHRDMGRRRAQLSIQCRTDVGKVAEAVKLAKKKRIPPPEVRRFITDVRALISEQLVYLQGEEQALTEEIGADGGLSVARRCEIRPAVPLTSSNSATGQHQPSFVPTVSAGDIRRRYEETNYAYLALLGEYGQHLGWPSELHDRFLRVVQQVNETAGGTQIRYGEFQQYIELPRQVELREACLATLGGSIGTAEVDRHIQLYCRYLSLMQERAILLEFCQAEQTAEEAHRKVLSQQRAVYASRVQEDEHQRLEVARQSRQMFLKQKVQLWKEKKQQEAAAAAERQRELAEKQQRATQLAEKRKQEERERKRQELEAYKQRKQAPSADREQSGARLSRQQLEARHALAKRREADILAAKERYEQRKPKEAVPYLATGDDEVYVKSTSHFADPTTSSMQRQEARPSDRLPLEGTKDAWLNPAAQERWQAVAHVHSSVYRPHTSTASWCGRTFQL